MITINDILEVENYLGNIDGVIFDLDDTLYSEKEYIKSGYRAISYEFPQVDNLSEKLWRAFLQGQKAIDAVFEQENLLEYKELALDIYRKHKPEISLYPGVESILERLHGNQKKIGLITDGRPNGQRAKIEALHLTRMVDFIIITDEMGSAEFRKPNPAAFIEMQKKMNIPFNKTCYIGDNIKKDFMAPEKLGMETIYFKNKDGLY